jgi:hypothetical protein
MEFNLAFEGLNKDECRLAKICQSCEFLAVWFIVGKYFWWTVCLRRVKLDGLFDDWVEWELYSCTHSHIHDESDRFIPCTTVFSLEWIYDRPRSEG